MRLRASLIALLLVPAATARAGNTGGAAAPGAPVNADEAGGVAYGSPIDRPAALLRVSPGARPRLIVRITEQTPGVVVARLEVLRMPGSRRVAQFKLGRVRVGRTVSVQLRRALRPGRYEIRVHAHDASGRQLRNVPRVPLIVHGTHVPVTASGVFPVAGPHTYGDAFGAPRKGYAHQGQDILAPRGTPIVAPVAGAVYTTGYQASAAGEYVVLNATDGHAYFFAHCVRHSTVVSPGQVVAAGAPLCSLGATGDATGPHLHFEEWVGGWRVDANSMPVDPLPQLRAWDNG